MPSLSTRIQALPFSATRKYLPFVKALQAKGVFVHELNIGQPDVVISPRFYASLREISAPVLAYAPSAGYEPLREAISRYYQRLAIRVASTETIVSSGASEALTMLMDALCDPGDEVLVFEPFYANYQSIAEVNGVHLRGVSTRLEDGFALPSLAAIAEVLAPRTKAILFASPGNPTGAVFSREDLVGLVALAREKNIFLIADEVYREFVFGEERATSILEIDGSEDVAIVVDSVSKRYSACGARIGWMVTRRKDVLAEVLKLAQMRLSVPTIEQMAAVSLLDDGDEDIQRAKSAYQARRDVAHRLLTEAGIVCGSPRGALYVMADLGVDAEAFTEYMLTSYSGIETSQETVLTTPAAPFYLGSGVGKTQVRIAFVVTEEALGRALQHLIKGREEFMSANDIPSSVPTKAGRA